MKKSLYLPLIACALLGFCSCLDDGDDTIILEELTLTDIPSDKDASEAPEIVKPNATIPNPSVSTVDENGQAVVRIDMTGIQNQNSGEWIRLYGTGEKEQNVWVTVDGKPKGIKVYNTADDGEQHSVPIDLTFLVDNSGSMSEEADVIARDIKAWSKQLQESGLDVRFAVVGYDGAITGAFLPGSADKLSEYLDRRTGVYRTMGMDENTYNNLSQGIGNYTTGGNSRNECGMAALRFADEKFKFRKIANRIYVNFTDEPNQPNGNSRFSVESLRDNWSASQGTIHTVYSGGNEYGNSYLKEEQNSRMSEYTGGTVLYTNSYFTGVSLSSLPVSDAMLNSYIIRFTNVKDLMDGQPHEVKVTVYAANGQVAAEIIVYVIFEMAE